MEKCYGKGARNDAAGMQYLTPGWEFDNKKPCMVRLVQAEELFLE